MNCNWGKSILGGFLIYSYVSLTFIDIYLLKGRNLFTFPPPRHVILYLSLYVSNNYIQVFTNSKRLVTMIAFRVSHPFLLPYLYSPSLSLLLTYDLKFNAILNCLYTTLSVCFQQFIYITI